MKSILLFLAAATASASLLAVAQSASPAPAPAPADAAASPSPGASRPSTSPGTPEASSVPLPDQPSGPALEKTMPLIPETAPAGRGKQATHDESHTHAVPGVSPHGTFDVEQDIRLSIRFRQAETRVSNEPAIQAYWAAAHVPRTDPARRAALTVYYNHLYDRMIQLDPKIAALANARRQTAISRMLYVHLGDAALPADANPFATPIPDDGGVNPPLGDVPPGLP